MNLTHTRIVAKDVEALVHFYEEITGISAVGNEDYAEIRTSTATLAITSQRAIDLHAAGGAAPAANHSAIIEFQVGDVDRERSRLAGIIGECVLEPTDQPWGNRSMLFSDPDGNLINFYAPIFRPAVAPGKAPVS
jgi:predicted enzyme related to lactoylglutathione lyase